MIGIGLCALVGVAQGWLRVAGTLLFVCGASSAFIGLIAAGVGSGGPLGGNRSKAMAIVGLALGLQGVCLFLMVLGRISGG